MFNEWEEKILDQLKNNHQQCQNLVLARGWELRQRSGEIELKGKPGTCALLETFQSPVDPFSARKAFWTAAGVLYSAYIFLYLMMVRLDRKKIIFEAKRTHYIERKLFSKQSEQVRQ